MSQASSCSDLQERKDVPIGVAARLLLTINPTADMAGRLPNKQPVETQVYAVGGNTSSCGVSSRSGSESRRETRRWLAASYTSTVYAFMPHWKLVRNRDDPEAQKQT